MSTLLSGGFNTCVHTRHHKEWRCCYDFAPSQHAGNDAIGVLKVVFFFPFCFRDVGLNAPRIKRLRKTLANVI